MKIFVVESKMNSEIVKYVSKKYSVETDVSKLNNCNVVIVGLVKDVKMSLRIVDTALHIGIEVICVKNKFCKETFVSDILIKEGAIYV